MSRLVSTFVSHAASELGRVPTFEELYEAHFDFVFRCLRRLGVAEAHAEDAVQETFMVLHRRLGDLRPDASARAFLFAIARRVGSDLRKKQARTSALPLSDELFAPASTSPFDDTANTQAARLLERFLDTLDEDQRAVFMLIELEELTAPEVRDALAVNLNTVYSRLRLARGRFVRFLREEGGLP